MRISNVIIGIVLLVFSLPVSAASPITLRQAQGQLTRREAFLRVWESLQRPVGRITEEPYDDVQPGDAGYEVITYAKDRGLLGDVATFRPDAPLTLSDALVWLFRTRSVEPEEADLDEITAEHLPELLGRYPVTLRLATSDPRATDGLAPVQGLERQGHDAVVTEEEFLSLMRDLDTRLAEEAHEVSLYAEKFHGDGTAFGETFDMYALTAAHRTLPFNTLVRVTNRDNGKSVLVRINDRGPFVKGRDMDLSLASFLQLSTRAAGVLRSVTFQRLGDVNLIGPCSREPLYQSRITRDARLLPGVPHVLRLGAPMNLHGPQSFVVLSVRYPDGNSSFLQDWILPGENFRFVPSIAGEYTFTLGTIAGRRREMAVQVMECPE